MAEDMHVKCELGEFWSGTVVRWLQDAGTRHVSNFCPSDVHACHPHSTHQTSSKLPTQDYGCRAWVRGVRQRYSCALVCPVNLLTQLRPSYSNEATDYHVLETFS